MVFLLVRILLVPLVVSSTLIIIIISATIAATTSAATTATTHDGSGGFTVKILAVFDQSDIVVMDRVMYKTLAALNKEKTALSTTTSGGSSSSNSHRRQSSSSSSPFQQQLQRRRLSVQGVAVTAQWWANQTADQLDQLLTTHKPAALLVLSVDDQFVFRVSIAAADRHLPVIGIRQQRGLDDTSFQAVSPYYVGLNPGPDHLAFALRHLLLANDWLPITLIVDDSLRAQKIKRVVQQVGANTADQLVNKVMVVTVNRDSVQRRIVAQLSGIQQTTSLVIAFCCDSRLASRLYAEARRLNMLNGDWVWLALEEATEGDPTAGDWPLGLLGLVSQRPQRFNKHTMKGSLAILHSAIRASLPVQQQFHAWNDNFNNNHSSLRLDVARKLYSEMSWRMKEALAGRLTYDGGGRVDTALRANFDVVNLVSPGPFYHASLPLVASTTDKGNNINNNNNSSTASAFRIPAARRKRSATTLAADNQTHLVAKEEEEESESDEMEEENVAMDPAADGQPTVGPSSKVVTHSGGGDHGGFILDDKNKMLKESLVWQSVGNVSGRAVTFKGVQWPGGGLAGPRSYSRRVYRVATIFSPPFVMETEVFKDEEEDEEEEEMEKNSGETEEQRCLTGVPCLRVATSQKDELARIFGDYTGRQLLVGIAYNLTCCYGYSIDLMENVARDLEVQFQVYVVADGQCGAKRASKWDGIVADLRSGAAHLSFAPLSVTSGRSEVIDFSIPYFYSGLSILEASKSHDDVPLLAFLKPFSPDLWIGIFVSLNVTALAVAVYEWLSPFGLNPWGRQRTKNFSLASALWVMWGLLFSHLVAFKAPKSWPNKFLINVWGGFSVIFLASYTANIAALFAGVFSETTVTNFHDPRLLSQKVGTTRSSAADHYALKTDRKLWEHLQKFTVPTLEEGVARLRDGRLDLLIGDTPILDYYRANDPGCTLRTVDVIEEDNYAVGMTKGLHLQTSISSLISSYSTSGYMDELRSKWYSSTPCSRSANDAYRPQPLGVPAVAGVFILLGFGILAGCLILVLEHLVYKYALPGLRRQSKGTIWRSPNMMFFSQKLYRFINCVELLSPHHAAKELMHSLRQGQITSLFQKSVKRKEIEQKRRRKSKAQFFEMIREVRRYQQEERDVVAEENEDEEDGYEDQSDEDDGDEEETEGRDIRLKHLGVIDDPVGSGGGQQHDDGEMPSAGPIVSVVVEDDKRYTTAPTTAITTTTRHPKPGCLKHSLSTLTDPGFYAEHPLTTRPSSEKRWMQKANRRRSFSADVLSESTIQPLHRRGRRGVRFADSSSSSDSSRSNLSEQHNPDDESAGGAACDTSSSLLCSMVDRATLNKLTKEDLLLLWQAAESEWLVKVRSLAKQRDILQLRYQHARGSAPPSFRSPPFADDTTN